MCIAPVQSCPARQQPNQRMERALPPAAAADHRRQPTTPTAQPPPATAAASALRSPNVGGGLVEQELAANHPTYQATNLPNHTTTITVDASPSRAPPLQVVEQELAARGGFLPLMPLFPGISGVGGAGQGAAAGSASPSLEDPPSPSPSPASSSPNPALAAGAAAAAEEGGGFGTQQGLAAAGPADAASGEAAGGWAGAEIVPLPWSDADRLVAAWCGDRDRVWPASGHGQGGRRGRGGAPGAAVPAAGRGVS